MQVGLISDSHDHIDHLDKAVGIFNDRDVDLVLHTGDFCSPFMIPPFAGLDLKAVFGNNDGDHYMLLQKIREIGAEHLGTFGEVQVDDRNIALYHGTDTPVTAALEQCGNYDAVVSGHTHDARSVIVDGTLAINPGTVHGFGQQATIALLETELMDVEFLELD